MRPPRCPLSKMRRLRSVFPHAEIFLMYGLTECQRASYLPPGLIDQCPDSVGVPIPGTSVQVVDEDGRPVGPGIVGELVVRGPHVMKGYWNDAEATAQVLRPDGESGEMLLHTGDLFRTGTNRLLYFVERRDDVIKVRGEKVAPRQIEEVIARLAGRRRGVRLRRPRRRGRRSDRGGGQAVRRRHVDGRRDPASLPRTPGAVHGADDRGRSRHAADDDKREGQPARAKTVDAATRRISGMSTVTAFSADLLRIDAPAVASELQAFLRDSVFYHLRRKGLVVGLSGGIDSSVVGALAARALGPERVVGLMMPEADSSDRQPDACGRGWRTRAGSGLFVKTSARRWPRPAAIDGAMRPSAARCRSTATGGDPRSCCPTRSRSPDYAIYSIVVRAPSGEERRVRLPLDAYLGIVAATNFKQRVRKMMEYHYADRLRYAVAGTANLLEHDQGFFVKLGDGAADVKPIAHLYKSQVYQLAEFLGVPEDDPTAQADDRYLSARTIAGRVLLRPLTGTDRPVHLRTRSRYRGSGSGAGRWTDRRAGCTRLRRHRFQARGRALPSCNSPARMS